MPALSETPPPMPANLKTSRKAAYAAGGLTDFLFLNVLLSLATQIYVTGMGMNIVLLGFVLAIPKIAGALADPFVGSMSDNTHSRWGRRRPYILIGGLAGSALLPLMWFVPTGSDPGPIASELASGLNHLPFLAHLKLNGTDVIQFGYLAGMISVFSVCHSLFSIPYGALGYELSDDYHERTRLFAWKGYLMAIGALSAAWFYKFCTLRELHPRSIPGLQDIGNLMGWGSGPWPMFPHEVIGVRWLSGIAAVAMIAGTVATVMLCREKTRIERQHPVPLLKAMRLTFRNRAFLLLQAAIQILGLVLAVTGPMGWLVFFYYVCEGSKSAAADITAYGGSIAFLTQIAANAFGLWLSTRLGKRGGGMVGFGLVGMSIAILPWALTPEHPWWNVGAWVISGLGMPLITLMANSMSADICDEDELATGMRREGAYSAANGFLGKFMQIVIVLAGGLLPLLAGYGGGLEAPPIEQLMCMKWLLIGIQGGGVLLAFLAFRLYPITQAKSAETRELLAARHRAESIQ